MEPFVGQIIAVGFNFAPVGWLLCNGQTVAISEYNVLFNLIGTTYGGNGTTTFALPNLCGRSPLSVGTGAGLPTAIIGQAGGTESVTLTPVQIASHAHGLQASSSTGAVATPTTSTVLAAQSNADFSIYGTVAGNITLSPGTIQLSGGSQPHENRQPYLVVNYIIAAFGVYPSQN